MIREYLLDLEIYIGQFVDLVPRFWNYKLFSIDKSPITVGILIICLFAIFFGQYAIRKLTRIIDNKVFIRFELHNAARSTLRTFTSYFLFVVLFLVILSLMNIPLTVFTLVGGALAVGIGLGSQSIVYDFLSGLIIVMEHPVREGDLIEVDKLTGVVERIGARATRILTLDHKHMVVPNNYLLSRTVVNWTLSNEVIRSEVKVGVVYGSPVEKVIQLIEKAVSESKKIEKRPAPVVFLSEFGENSLVFTIYFWASIRSMIEFNKTHSDLRLSLYKLFEENNIIIAFPQRDVHLHPTKEPVQVQILSHSSKKP